MATSYNTITNKGDFSYFRQCSKDGSLAQYYPGVTWDFPTPESSTREYEPFVRSEYGPNTIDYPVSFTKVKQSRLIKMTPYSIGSTETTNHLVSIPRTLWTPKVSHQYFWDENRVCTGSDTVHIPGKRSYVEQADLTWLRFAHPTIPYYKCDDYTSEVEKTLIEVRSNVFERNTSTIDALTNIAETPETLKLILDLFRTVRNPLKATLKLKRRYDRALREGKVHSEIMSDLSGQWLQLRYGIMPVILSIMDLVDLLDKQADEFKTNRSQLPVDLVSGVPPDTKEHCFWEEVHGEILVGAVAKARFDQPGLRLLDQVKFNPVVTAWELIPFSFVLDWFANVGDVLSIHTSQLGDTASQRVFCSSVKVDIVKNTFYQRYVNDACDYHHGPAYTSGLNPDVQICNGYTINDNESGTVRCLMRSEVIKTYERTLDNPHGTSLSWNPSLSWMRQLDSIALAYNLSTSYLKQR